MGYEMDLRYYINSTILEMAMPTDDIKNKTFYHGTSNSSNAISIAKNGLVPPEIKNPKASLAPVRGKVYATPHLSYAQIYAIGGDIAGSTRPLNPKEDKHGYVFAFSGHKLNDIQPDEDEVGELFFNKKHPAWMHYLIHKHCSENTIKRTNEGEYAAFARIGKKILPKMTDSQKLELVTRYNTHIAHTGGIIPDKVYQIDKHKIPLLKSDGSNFFEHAKEIKMEDLAKGLV